MRKTLIIIAALVVSLIVTYVLITNNLGNQLTKDHNELGNIIVQSSNARSQERTAEHQQMVDNENSNTKLILDKLDVLIGNGSK